ncbi:MAG: hypothetical protein EA343_14265 [Nodularia sp. (in: Bacteria)]|nr:MAG: hypothetical protein EA343_14265 [Nodularia sp. (in: cyanobacteria)]
MKNSQYFHPNFEQFFQRISPEVKKTFTQEQLQAIKMACESSNQNHPGLNIRLSLKVFRSKFYIVLLAGKERRSKQRLQDKNTVYPLRNPVNVLFLLGLFIIFIISSFAILSLVFPSISFMPTSPHPTSIPWINNKFDCERTYRIWNDDKCWDSEHSPTF